MKRNKALKLEVDLLRYGRDEQRLQGKEMKDTDGFILSNAVSYFNNHFLKGGELKISFWNFKKNYELVKQISKLYE